MNPIRRAARLALAALAAVVASFALAVPAAATSYVPIADRDLAAQAEVIALVDVVAVEPGPADAMPATDYLVAADELVQGYLPGSTVVVRVPGGMRADGIGLEIEGAPALAVGEKALLFLNANEDGSYSILHLMLGAFHARAAAGAVIAEQDLDGAVSLAGPAKQEGGRRDLARFVAWLADRAAGVQREADYWVRGSRTTAPQEKAFAYYGTSDGISPRWFGFDGGGRAGWRVQSSGQPGLGFDATAAAVQAAMEAWDADPTSAISYTYDGTTTATGGLTSNDGVDAFVFGDPHGTAAGTFDCNHGGVLAVGGSWYWSSTRDYRGRAYHEVVESDVVVNDGTECFFAGNPAGAAEVFAHELGHTLGFGHASDPQSLMFPNVHNDGRGARLGEDDRVGASVVYGDGSYQPAPSGGAGSGGATQAFTVAASRTTQTTIDLAWTASFADVASFRVELVGKKGSFQVLATAGGDETSVTVGGFKKNQLVTLRVTALRADGAVAGASNTLKVRTKK
ncbi:MAG TPA: matrixin family metalloprotease [Thermoanaerobaculia bacterium]|jgi:hypothetical protein|nr:matrixin family metalloprotease [Thermoanaerobaculia bacterium]